MFCRECNFAQDVYEASFVCQVVDFWQDQPDPDVAGSS